MPQKPNQGPVPPLNGWSLALDRAPLFLSVLLLFLTPFIIQVKGADPLYPKLALTQILVSLMFCSWVLKVLLTGRVVWVQTKAHLFLWTLLGWVLITLVFSPYSWIGWSAITKWICFPLWYLLLTITIIEAWKSENLIIVFLVAALGTSGWAIGQAFGLSGGAWFQIVKNQFNGRVTGGISDAYFLAGDVFLVLALAFGFFVCSPTFWREVICLRGMSLY